MPEKIKLICIFVLFVTIAYFPQPKDDYRLMKKNYSQLSGELFRDVQLSKLFPDSKTFVDAVPLREHEFIRNLYDSVKSLPDFDLQGFIYANFRIPGEKKTDFRQNEKRSMKEHISSLWDFLLREPEQAETLSTLIPLQLPYIVPGGRFREIYYWDSFFTMLGLLADKKIKVAENMALNFASLIDRYGMIPNGNRVYYLTRSQPPFFSLMVDLLCRYKKDYSYGLKFLPQLQAEYDFWMNGLENINGVKGESERVVKLDDSTVLNRYFDYDTIPREESFREDFSLGDIIPEEMRHRFYRNLRAAAESGWDFSSRWFSDGQKLASIVTTDIIPVDLNCLLYFLEDRLAFFYELRKNDDKSSFFRDKAMRRKETIKRIFWDSGQKFFSDYNFRKGSLTPNHSLAACFPLYFNIASNQQAVETARQLEKSFLRPGGLVTTLIPTGQQWDAPNGWPPLQWMAIKGLREYGLNGLADTVKMRWLSLNESVYRRTGRMLEKYNVEDLSLFAGGGEYPLQDGFGWTNGVALALLSGLDRLFLNKK